MESTPGSRNTRRKFPPGALFWCQVMIRVRSQYWAQKTGTVVTITLFLVLLVPSQAAQICGRPVSTLATSLELPAGPIDQKLFSSAVLANVNYHRCVEGKNSVNSHEGLNTVAKNHANWMATESRLSHASMLAGESTVTARVVSAVATPSTGSENIGYVHRFAMMRARRFLPDLTLAYLQRRRAAK